ncbi:MAG TPA: class I SAM-dependent methyltransferase [Candidatus Binatus sp.]|nr:class I SAM-dependent methyltransferase [Candidatus Binatus sp.]
MVRRLYDTWYRWGNPPWVGSARSELVRLVETGALQPGRAIDLGCGVGDNAIFLAAHGFDVTAIDFAASAVERGRRKAAASGATVDFRVADLTRLPVDLGSFDLLVDYGTFDDLGPSQRAAYVRGVVPLARPGGQFLLWCFEWPPSRVDRIVARALPVTGLALAPGEVERWFSGAFDIDRIAGESGRSGWPKGWAAYLMRRGSQPEPTGRAKG